MFPSSNDSMLCYMSDNREWENVENVAITTIKFHVGKKSILKQGLKVLQVHKSQMVPNLCFGQKIIRQINIILTSLMPLTSLQNSSEQPVPHIKKK